MRRVRFIAWLVGGLGFVGPGCAGDVDGSSSAGVGGTSSNPACEIGLTRVCVGPGACAGGQKCLPDGTWSDCDCGESGSGGMWNSSGRTATGGLFPLALGGSPPGQGGVGTGDVPVIVLGGFPTTFGGYPTMFGGYPTAYGGYPTVTGGRPSTSGSLNVTAGGYVQSSTYKGYAWTATESPSKGSTITPANFSTLTTATQLCVSGSVAPDAAYGGMAKLGINLNQAVTGGTGSVLSYTPTGSSVTVDVTNTGGSPLRVQIEAPGGDTDPNLRWCADLTGSGGTIALSSFNTRCWDASGTFYTAGTPLELIEILVPGGNATATDFNFCLNALSI